MPLSSTETERRILQLDDDVSEIYTMIADVQNTQRRHTHRFAEMGSRLDDLVDRSVAVEGRLEGVQGRLEGVEGHLEGVERSVAGVEGRLGGMTGQLDEVLTLLRDRR